MIYCDPCPRVAQVSASAHCRHPVTSMLDVILRNKSETTTDLERAAPLLLENKVSMEHSTFK